MALNSSSTKDDAQAQADNNLAWIGNPTKAANLLEALIWFIIHEAESFTGAGGESISRRSLESLYREVSDYVISNVATTATGTIGKSKSITIADFGG